MDANNFSSTLLVVLHIIFAVLWFAYPLGMVRIVRQSLSSGRPAFLSACQENERRLRNSNIAGTLTVLLGVHLISQNLGGFSEATPNFHMAFGLGVLLLLYGFLFLRSQAGKITAIAQDEQADLNTSASLIKRYAMFSGIQHGMWLVLLVLMYKERF